MFLAKKYGISDIPAKTNLSGQVDSLSIHYPH